MKLINETVRAREVISGRIRINVWKPDPPDEVERDKIAEAMKKLKDEKGHRPWTWCCRVCEATYPIVYGLID